MDKKLIIAIGVIIVLVGILIYFFFVQPAIQNYLVSKQVEGYTIGVEQIFRTAQQQGYIQITFEEETITLLVVEPPEQGQQQPPTPIGEDDEG